MEEREYYLGFSVFPGIGPAKFDVLLTYFETAKNAWNASEHDLKDVLGEKLSAQFFVFRQSFALSGYEQKLHKEAVSFLTLSDTSYPSKLKMIKNTPFVLYGKNLQYLSGMIEKTIAVVGARSITTYGKEVTELFTRELVESGLTIVSGLAEGVDAVAHATTLEYEGSTIAVLGCGVDCCYPSSNQSLYNRILEKKGVILSEVPLGSKPSRGLFPARNRIVAGLSLGVVVTEGAEDSGSLITAEFALKNDRKVFAVPGPITSRLSEGPYHLLKKGAVLATSADDILQQIGMTVVGVKGKNRVTGDTNEEQNILDHLMNEICHFDELVRKTGIEAPVLGGILSLMEMKGMVKVVEGQSYALT